MRIFDGKAGLTPLKEGGKEGRLTRQNLRLQNRSKKVPGKLTGSLFAKVAC